MGLARWHGSSKGLKNITAKVWMMLLTAPGTVTQLPCCHAQCFSEEMRAGAGSAEFWLLCLPCPQIPALVAFFRVSSVVWGLMG